MSMDLKDLLDGTSTGYTRDLDDMVVEVLRKAILSGHFKSGEKIAPAEIAEILQVSRMPVREAVQKLEAYGIVTVTGGRGSVVRGLSAKEFGQLCMVRGLLEPTAAGLAAENITEAALRKLEQVSAQQEQANRENLSAEIPILNYDFHHTIAESCGNPFLSEIIDILLILTTIYWNSTVSVPYLDSDNLAEHREILEALATGDAEKASREMARHLSKSEETIRRSMEE
jgi:DNA-binding GntR family transcriptional regulator